MEINTQAYETLRVRVNAGSCFIQICRPDANNTINGRLVDELSQVLDRCEAQVAIVVLEGLPEVFCLGADFNEMQQSVQAGVTRQGFDPRQLYDVWLRLAAGPYITVAHVRGQANAGGIGFVAACDVVICDEKATFGLSELLFGLMPACVLPFLVRRVGYSKANYMTLTTEPVAAKTAKEWGLVDDFAGDSEGLLRKRLLRLGRLSKAAVRRYKQYSNALHEFLTACRSKALAANLEVFSDRENLARISRYVTTGRFPWEPE